MIKKTNLPRRNLKLDKETVLHLSTTMLTQVGGAIPPTRVTACCTLDGCEPTTICAANR